MTTCWCNYHWQMVWCACYAEDLENMFNWLGIVRCANVSCQITIGFIFTSFYICQFVIFIINTLITASFYRAKIFSVSQIVPVMLGLGLGLRPQNVGLGLGLEGCGLGLGVVALALALRPWPWRHPSHCKTTAYCRSRNGSQII